MTSHRSADDILAEHPSLASRSSSLTDMMLESSDDSSTASMTGGGGAVEQAARDSFSRRIEFDPVAVSTLRRMSRLPYSSMLTAREEEVAAAAAISTSSDSTPSLSAVAARQTMLVEKSADGRDVVIAATPRALFEMLFPLDGEQDQAQVALLLHTYRGFCRADILLDALLERHAKPEDCFRAKSFARLPPMLRQSVLSRIRLQVHTVLRLWIKNYAIDFYNDAVLLRRLCAFLCASQSSSSSSSSSSHHSHAPPQSDTPVHLDDEQRRNYLLVLLQQHVFDLPIFLSRSLPLGVLFAVLQTPHNALPVAEHRRAKSQPPLFVRTASGRDIVDWLMRALDVDERAVAFDIANDMVLAKMLVPFESNTILFIDGIDRRYVISESTTQISLPPPVAEIVSKKHLKHAPKHMKYRCVLEFHPLEIARQLTLDGHDVFSRIQPGEFMKRAWLKGDLEYRMKFCPHIVAAADQFNHINRWVASEIVLCDDDQQRLSTLKRMIEIAHICRTLHNLHSMYAIYVGLNMWAVQRLKLLWGSLPAKWQKQYELLEAVATPMSNSRALRQLLAEFTPPVVPPLDLFLRDLTAVGELDEFLELPPPPSTPAAVPPSSSSSSSMSASHALASTSSGSLSSDSASLYHSTTDEPLDDNDDDDDDDDSLGGAPPLPPSPTLGTRNAAAGGRGPRRSNLVASELPTSSSSSSLSSTSTTTSSGRPRTAHIRGIQAIEAQENRLVNLRRKRLEADIIARFRRSQRGAYTFAVNSEVRDYLWNARPVCDDAELARLSKIAEPGAAELRVMEEERKLQEDLSGRRRAASLSSKIGAIFGKRHDSNSHTSSSAAAAAVAAAAAQASATPSNAEKDDTMTLTHSATTATTTTHATPWTSASPNYVHTPSTLSTISSSSSSSSSSAAVVVVTPPSSSGGVDASTHASTTKHVHYDSATPLKPPAVAKLANSGGNSARGRLASMPVRPSFDVVAAAASSAQIDAETARLRNSAYKLSTNSQSK